MLLSNRNERWDHFTARYREYMPDIDEDICQVLSLSAMISCQRRGKHAKDWDSMQSIKQDPLLVHDNEIYMYGPIGAWEDEVGFENVHEAVQSLDTDDVHIRLNSPGGDVMEGVAILNYLKRQPKPVIAHVDSIAASMGAGIALAANYLTMAPDAKLMVHNPHTIAMGNWRDFERQAAVLKDLTNDVARALADKSSLDFDQAFAAVDQETWYNAEQAFELGIASELDVPGDYDELVGRWRAQVEKEKAPPVELAKIQISDLEKRIAAIVGAG